MKRLIIFVVSIIGFGLFIYFNLDQTKAGGNDPGTIADPLVTKSYVDDAQAKLLATISTGGIATGATLDSAQMAEINQYINEQIKAVGVTPAGFVVIAISEGQKVMCDGSTEVILRKGEITVIANAAGDGVSDVTGGRNIANGQSVAIDHLCIVPRTDGRGFSVVKAGFLMIKGNYVIQ